MNDDDDVNPPIEQPPQPATSFGGEETTSVVSQDAAGDAVETVHKRRSPAAIATLIVGVLALVGGGIYAANNLVGTKSGAATPEDAARAFFASIANEDVLGLLDSMVPAERDAFREPLTEMRTQLVRLGALRKDFNLAHIEGINVNFQDLKFSTDRLSENVAVVGAIAGKESYRIDPQQLPLGTFVRDLAGEALTGPATFGSDTIDPTDDAKVAVVQKDGRWYWSLGYSIAESSREDSGAPAPNFGHGLAADGRESAAAAIEAALRAAVALDFETLIGITDPEEDAALHEYAPTFLAEAKALASNAAGAFRASITNLQLATEPKEGGVALVTIKHMEFKAGSTDGKFAVNFDGECFTSKGLGELFPPKLCTDELKQGVGLPQKQAHVGFIAVQRGGLWYFSPVRTILDAVNATLKIMTPQDLDQVKNVLGRFRQAA
ncbi:MAG: hypothetical protein ABR548_04755 [Actinomycetota bacterium]|nr:hypothetical protein [Actinomycetota bacterium]